MKHLGSFLVEVVAPFIIILFMFFLAVSLFWKILPQEDINGAESYKFFCRQKGGVPVYYGTGLNCAKEGFIDLNW